MNHYPTANQVSKAAIVIHPIVALQEFQQVTEEFWVCLSLSGNKKGVEVMASTVRARITSFVTVHASNGFELLEELFWVVCVSGLHSLNAGVDKKVVRRHGLVSLVDEKVIVTPIDVARCYEV
jgi:hypothetical protein